MRSSNVQNLLEILKDKGVSESEENFDITDIKHQNSIHSEKIWNRMTTNVRCASFFRNCNNMGGSSTYDDYLRKEINLREENTYNQSDIDNVYFVANASLKEDHSVYNPYGDPLLFLKSCLQSFIISKNHPLYKTHHGISTSPISEYGGELVDKRELFFVKTGSGSKYYVESWCPYFIDFLRNLDIDNGEENTQYDYDSICKRFKSVENNNEFDINKPYGEPDIGYEEEEQSVIDAIRKNTSE